MGLLDRIRPQPGWKDDDPRVRRAAVRGLTDTALLTDVARTDPEPHVREEAIDTLLGLALHASDAPTALAALDCLTDHRHLAAVARAAASDTASRAALARLSDVRAFGSVARHGTHAEVRLRALERLDDPDEILAVALKSPQADTAVAALDRLTSGPDPGANLAALQAVAHRARSAAAARRARGILHDRREAERQAAPVPTDRGRQERLCERVEALAAHSEDCEQLASALAAAQDAWTDLIPDIDDDLAERFATACHAARERLAANEAARAERLRHQDERARFIAQHVAPRIALCEALETAAVEAIPRLLEDARREWDRLVPLHTPEIEALRSRFEDTCAAAAGRGAAREAEAAAARGREEAAALREGRTREARDNAARLEALCAGLEELLATGDLTLKEADPRLRDVRAALAEIGPLPSKRERNGFLKRLRDLHQRLTPEVQDLREEDAWKRWANANVQEELCAEAESLREVADPIVAVRRLNEITERWKSASSASKDRAGELWQRFKTARDEVIGRLKEHRARQAADRNAAKTAKEALCARAEALAEATDWAGTAQAIRELQAEWKSAGPAPRKDEQALWDRFRSASDRFFRHRDEALAKRRDEWRAHLEAKEALCAQAESLADATDWAATGAEIRRLQAEWKTVGPVRRNRSEVVWRRFRSACDRFYERYKKREAIDRELTAALREALCGEAEAIAAQGAASDPFTALRSVWTRWRQAAPMPAAALEPLHARLDAALGRVLAGLGEAVRGTEFDVDENRRRLEDLCARAEQLLPSGGEGGLEGLSPVARLAATWREALASNTIGGKAAGDARRRAAREELQKIEAAARRIGYLPGAVHRPLLERLASVTQKLPAPPERGEPARPGAATRRDGRRRGGARREGGPRDRAPREGPGRPGASRDPDRAARTR